MLDAAPPPGEVSVIGYNDMAEMLGALSAEYSRTHPGVRFRLVLEGTRTAPPALTDGSSAFAPMGAEFTDQDLAAYRAKWHSDPLLFNVAHDSLNPVAKSAPLGIFVHRDNPLSSITIEQLKRIYTEGQGDFHLYGIKPDAALALFLQKHQFGGRPFVAAMTGFPQSTDVVKAVGQDPRGIGFAAANQLTPQVKLLKVEGLSVAEPGYPLDRTLYIYARQPIDPLVRDYLKLVLSEQGQRLIASGTLGYQPLTAKEIAAERKKLEEAK